MPVSTSLDLGREGRVYRTTRKSGQTLRVELNNIPCVGR